ncbi:MAG: Gfo/Idh/MocA family oxidoreductase [Candidatus Latescibacterota bacterium]
MDNPVKVAVVGLGRSGWDIHVQRMRTDERFRITAVADFLPERRAEAQAEFGCAVFSDHQSLLKAADAHLVVVASYSFTHAHIATKALSSGRHVLVEKPIAMNAAQVDRMARARDESGSKLFVFLNYRYTKDYRHLREVMASRLIGDVFEIRIRLSNFSRRNDWQTLRAYGGGVLNNTCPHFLDIALRLLASPVAEVFSDLKLTSDVGDVEDHVKLVLMGENGRIVDLEVSSSCNLSEPKWTLLGTHGTLTSDGEMSQIRYFDPGKLSALSTVKGPADGRKYGNADQIPWEEKTVPSEGAVPHDLYDNLYAVLREGAEQDILLEEAREVVRITEAARKLDGFYGGVSRSFRPEHRG